MKDSTYTVLDEYINSRKRVRDAKECEDSEKQELKEMIQVVDLLELYDNSLLVQKEKINNAFLLWEEIRLAKTNELDESDLKVENLFDETSTLFDQKK